MAIDVDKLISDVRSDINVKPNQAKTSDGKPVIVKGNAKTTQGKKANTTPKDTDKPLGRASGQRAFTSTPKGDTKGESTLKAAGTGAAAAYTYLKGLLDEIDAQTKARDEADSARLKAGRDAAEQGVDINTADGGLKKAHEEQQKDFEARAAKYAGVGEDEFKRAQELYTKSAEYEATAKEGLGKVGQFAVDLGIAGTQFAGDMALNTILPGAGLAAMGARAAGQGAYSASLEGKDINEQLTSGLKSAAVEVLTEKLFGLGSKAAYGAGIVKNKNLVNAVVNRLAKTDKGRTVLKLLVGASEEGLEEVLADVLNPVADRLLKLDDGKGDWSDLGDDMDVEQMLTDYLLGAALGLAGSSVNIANGSFKAENEVQRYNEVYQRALVDSGLESAEGTKSRELAEKADKILSKSEKRGRRYLTDKEVEALREANIEAIAAEEATQTAQEAAKPRAASDIVADVAAGKVGAQEPTQQATNAPTMEKIIAAMTGKPIPHAAAESTSVNTDPGEHTAAEQRVIEEYQGAVDENLVNFYEAVNSGQNIKPYKLKPVSSRAAADIKRINGRDVSGYGVELEARQAHHIELRHGKNGIADSSMADVNDIGRIQWVLDNYDEAADGGSTRAHPEYSNGKNRPGPTVLFSKKVNGTYYVVEATPVNKNKKLHIISAFMTNNPESISPGKGNKKIEASPRSPDAQAPGYTSKNESANNASINNKIPDHAEAVNDKTAEYPSVHGEKPLRVTPESAAETTAVNPNIAKDDADVNDLPPGMGAASAAFTGEMSPAEQWVAEAQAQGDSALHPISDEQQRNLAEQQSRAPQELPKIDPMGNLTSKMAQTVMNSGVTPQEMSDAILNDAYDGRFSRIAYTDSEAINKAEDEIENGEGRYQGALERWKSAVDRGEVSKDNMVMGICLYNNAVTNGDYTTALDILDGLVVLGKNTGQALQAVRILNKLSPEGRLYVAAKAVDRINRDVKKRYGDKAPDISVDEGLYADYADALKSGDEAKIKSAWEAVEQNIADQIPASWADKLNAWRYLAMLGNVRTHARNFFGNAGFMPVRMMKNAIGAGIEGAVDALSKDGINRTKAFLNPADAADRALFHVAWADFSNARDAILSGGKYDDDLGGINDRRTIFKIKLLEGARKGNTKLLDVGDAVFSQPAYAESLASWLKANGITAAEYTSESFDVGKKAAAMEYAIKEAQKATYRDINFFSEFVTSMRVKTKSEVFNKAANAVISGVLPFRKTPANILVRAAEYSPLGLAKTIGYDGFYKLRKGKITAAEFIDNLSEGLTGTALVGLGMLLAKMGLLTGGNDDDDKQSAFDKLRGKQAYSVVIGDMSFTVDWLAPENMPVFIGVEIFNRVTDESEGGFDLLKTLGAIYSLTNPMLDMSMLQGVNELLSGLDYGDGDPLSTVIVTAVGSLASQFVPTIFGQIERVFTPTRQTTYIDRESSLSSNAQRYIGNLLNKIPIPGVDYNQIPYIDAWGRTEETGGVAERMVNNLINPAYVKKSGETWVDDELQRLYDLGETGVFPQKAAQDTKINGEYLSAEDYVRYAKLRGSESLKTVQDLISSSAYRNMSDADKAAAIRKAYDYADGAAKLAVKSETNVPSWISNAKKSRSPAQYISDQIYLDSVDSDGNGSSNSADKVRGLINGGYSGDKLVSKVREYMTTESGNCEIADLLERTQSADIDDKVALDVYEFKNSAKNDKNSNGKVTKHAKDKVKEYIGSLSIPAEQKNILYYSFYKTW